MGTLSFAQNDEGAWGYKVGGADTVIPFKTSSGEDIKINSGTFYIGQNTSESCTDVGFKPKKLLLLYTGVTETSQPICAYFAYDEEQSILNYKKSISKYSTDIDLKSGYTTPLGLFSAGASNFNTWLKSIDDLGFTLQSNYWGSTTMFFLAIG